LIWLRSTAMHTIEPTGDELLELNIYVEDWTTRTPLQRAICVCMLRGHTSPDAIASVLQVSESDVLGSLNSLWGVLYDQANRKLWFK
jgi:hypothetical protein